MTIETERPTFRGVVCLHCKAPIPVPNIVRSLLAAAKEDVGMRPQKSQVFNVRCPVCFKEKPYRMKEILDIEGTPEAAVLPPGPASVRWRPQDGMSKAAKA